MHSLTLLLGVIIASSDIMDRWLLLFSLIPMMLVTIAFTDTSAEDYCIPTSLVHIAISQTTDIAICCKNTVGPIFLGVEIQKYADIIQPY